MQKRQYLLLFGIFGILFLGIWIITARNYTISGSTSQHMKLPQEISFNFHIKPILSDKCFACHGPDANKREAGLRLDLEKEAKAELAENAGKYAVVPGSPGSSELIKRIIAEDASIIMPPLESHLSLSDREKEILKKWIKQGAPYERHWAFIPPEKKPLPEVENSEWPINEIDFFVLKTLEGKSLIPSSPASNEKLLRRISLDLTGLPPTIEEVNTFIQGNDLQYEAAVDHFLASSAYGEKMARDWMDVARYADSHGYQDDSYRTMWPWRDWVIHAFNENMPYDQFLTWQLAGDLLPEASKAQILATGFNRNHPITQEGGVIDEEYRSTYVSDRTNTLGKGILGLTLECAKCHDHKYDPFSQKDYFQLYAFFNQVNEKGIQMDAVQAKNARYYADAPFISIEEDDLEGILSFVNKQDTSTLNVMVMNDSIKRKTYVMARGNYDAPAEEVYATTPETIMEFPADLPKNRLGLAQWLTDPQNPLTARVFVNRIWATVFGQGLVKTIEDFGAQGALPSHPELLDWLAVDFMEHDWDIKHLLRKMVTSKTYRQSSSITPEMKELDPENVYLARGPRFRLSAEEIRDYVLSTSGLLNTEIGGPSVKPYQPPGLWEETNAGNNRGILTTYVEDKGDKLYRRSLYTFWKRTLPPPSMSIFDAPNRDLCEVRRQKTNTPLQALALQNDEQVLECSKAISARISEFDLPDDESVETLFKHILLRDPSDDELDLLTDYHKECINRFEKEAANAEKLLEVGQLPVDNENPAETAALMMVAQVLYNLDETITKE
jgi:hypothetical protein